MKTVNRLFHISHVECKENEQTNEKGEKVFTPVVPKSILKEENRTIPRICVAPHIEGCLNGIPEDAVHYLIDQRMKFIPYLMYVYSFHGVNESSVISNGEIIEKGYVPDADVSGECWLTEEAVGAQELIRITGFEMEERAFQKELIRKVYYEKPVEDYDRRYDCWFHRGEGVEEVKACVKSIRGKLLKEYTDGEHHYLSFKIPKHEDISPLWFSYHKLALKWYDDLDRDTIAYEGYRDEFETLFPHSPLYTFHEEETEGTTRYVDVENVNGSL
ncbi:hypothetical protein IMZ31_20130 (plasmid) [Pontibacillus sp. ALD_SL1]|uniref:hypothetical protein n=1 Tax=Pontibacillus sp. ALD_SL1 TaxID=2777185 RepID=UPI001A962DE2|nr:hypothetical protein [Pontibacillus sp. ALD_SL1]QST02860.1 hypothetical protein IMZ31_20130 [Pontibacillus sp. ALD_SL1]